MFKKLVGSLCATYAAADFNEDHHDILHGIETEFDKNELFAAFYHEFASESPVAIDEVSNRFDTFMENVESVITHNMKDGRSFDRGLNKFSAMTFAEFSEYFHLNENAENADQNCSATDRQSPLTADGLDDDVPDTWNWQNHGGVSPVKDQGSCGSCWTFSTVGCLESAHLIKYGMLETYSEQQLVDCAGDFDTYGCNGGLPSHAFEYAFYAGGMASEEAYPYFAVDQDCTVSSSDFILSVGHSVNITAGDETELKAAVYQQPVSVAFQVADDFSSYTTGVYTSTVCQNGPMDVNHAVLAVGYGTDDNGMDYWLIKNSWGTSWGMDGFFMMERGVNMCGIADCNSYPSSVEEISTATDMFAELTQFLN